MCLTRILVNFFLLLTVVPMPAAFADHLVLGESWESSKVSGHSGKVTKLPGGEYTYSYDWPPLHVLSASREVREDTAYAGIKGFSWWENRDKPCEFAIHRVSLNPVSSGTSSLTDVKKPPADNSKSICSGSAGDEKTVKFLDGTQRFVRGIAVCTSDKAKSSDERIKGLRIYAAKVNDNGTVEKLDVNRDDHRTNCKTWHAPVYCPSDYIVTALRLHQIHDYFTGIGIKCRQVNTAATPLKP